MSEEQGKPFEVVGDEALEARIVAWALGEVSEFEVGELRRLCNEQPEMELFRRRIVAVHGLAGEGLKKPATDWKLPAAKRQKVLDAIGWRAREARRERSSRFAARRVMLAAAACLVLTVVVVGLVTPALLRANKGADLSETPTIVTYQAARRSGEAAPADGEGQIWAGNTRQLVPLVTDLPAGRIEGTPKNVKLRGLADAEPTRAPVVPARPTAKPKPSKVAPRTPAPATGPVATGPVAVPEPAPAEKPASASRRVAAGDEARTAQFGYYSGSGGERGGSPGGAGGGGAMAGKDEVTDARMELSKLAENQDKLSGNRSGVVGYVDGGSGSGSGSGYFLDHADGNGRVPELGEVPVSGALFKGMAAGSDSRGEVAAHSKQAATGKEQQVSNEKKDVTALVAGIAGLPSDGVRAGDMAVERDAVDRLAGIAKREAGLAGDRSHAEDGAGIVDGRGDTWFDVDGEVTKRRRDHAARIKGGSDVVWTDPDSDEGVAGDPFAAVDAGGTLQTRKLAESLGSEASGSAGLGIAADAPADSAGNAVPTEESRRRLSRAEGNLALARLADAKREFENELKAAPDDQALRLGLERVERATDDYYRAAYDETRAKLLTEVDAAWESAVPANGKAGEETEELEELQWKMETAKTAEPESAVKQLQDQLGEQLVEEGGPAGGAQIEIIREFIYPKEYEPPELPHETSAKSAIDLMAEMSAAEEPFSTFSLHVSDASFRVAAAALARGERPEPEAVRPEEFYNAFDYGDPAPTAGEPVACAIEQCAHPLLPSRNLVRVGVRTAAAGRGAGQALRLTVLLDNSGSMEREDRRAAVAAAMEQLASLLGPQDVVTVVGFARQPRLLADRVSGEGVAEQLKNLVEKTPAEGGTNLEQALALAGELAMRQFDGAAQNRIVLLTDGAANLGNADPEELAKRVEGLRQQGVSFDAAGFGTAGLNDRMLERLTRDGNGRYYVVDGPEDAGEGFAKKLAGAFRPAAENVKVQVRFNPARVGGYRLIGFEEHRLKKEDFRDDTVDAAEMASEEAGVAVYQVELLPDGEGEIGEVSVRFRDAGKGKMVERSWTMPHDESAPGFDRAPASMQVAGLAVLAADALRDGPLAPLTDWSELAPVSNRVRAEFGGSEKVGQLLQMVERLRE